MSKLRPYALFWAVALCFLLLDQATKFAVQYFHKIDPAAFMQTDFGLARLVYVENPGAAFGMMSGAGPFLGLLAIGALLAIYWLRGALQIRRMPMQIAFGMLTAGIAGNMIDRLILGYVVDFVDISFGSLSFPAFNVADIGISVGVVMYILYSTFEGNGHLKEEAKKTA